MIIDGLSLTTINTDDLDQYRFRGAAQPGKGSASTKSHASGKIENPYFRILRVVSDVFFDADSDAPHMT